MNNDLVQVLITYATRPHKELSALLLDKSKDALISLLTDLLTVYINDKNSSTIREFVTLTLAGYTHSDKKIGYNGFKQSVQIGGEPIACEAKPRNINTENNKLLVSPRKHDGGGNFTDYTPERLKKDLKAKPNILASGFVDGELVYILEFPFKTPSFVKRLKMRLNTRFGSSKRKKGSFLRSANFNYKDYEKTKYLRLIYINKEALERTRANFHKIFYRLLLKLSHKNGTGK